jgi:hypothetical protein
LTPGLKSGENTNNIRYSKPATKVKANRKNWIAADKSTFLQVRMNVPIVINTDNIMIDSVLIANHMVEMMVAN